MAADGQRPGLLPLDDPRPAPPVHPKGLRHRGHVLGQTDPRRAPHGDAGQLVHAGPTQGRRGGRPHTHRHGALGDGLRNARLSDRRLRRGRIPRARARAVDDPLLPRVRCRHAGAALDDSADGVGAGREAVQARAGHGGHGQGREAESHGRAQGTAAVSRGSDGEGRAVGGRARCMRHGRCARIAGTQTRRGSGNVGQRLAGWACGVVNSPGAGWGLARPARKALARCRHFFIIAIQAVGARCTRPHRPTLMPPCPPPFLSTPCACLACLLIWPPLRPPPSLALRLCHSLC